MSELIRREPSSVPAAYEPPSQNIWIDDYLDERESEIARYTQVILKRKRLVLSIVLAVTAAAVAYTYFSPRLYMSSVKIQIDPEQSVLPYKEVYEVKADPSYLGTQAQVLKSEMLARRMVTRLKLASDPDEAGLVANWLRMSLTVMPLKDSQVVSVSFASRDRAFAAKAVNALADEYLSYTLERKLNATTDARNFLEQELAKQRKKLERSETELVKYSREHGIFLPSEKDNVILQKLVDLNQEMTKVEAHILSNQYLALNQTTPDNFPESLKTNVMKDLDSRRSSLEQRLAPLTARFGPKWPEVVTLNQELADVQQQLQNERRRAFEQARVEYDLAVAHRQRLASALAGQNRMADQLSQDSIQFNILKREVESDRQLHDGLLQRLKEMDVSAGLKAANVHVIDRGQVPLMPYSPNVPRNIALGLALGLMLGVFIAVGRDFLDATIKTPDDVERELRLPLLGAITTFDRKWTQATGAALLPLTRQSSDTALARQLNPMTEAYWENYRALRTSLLFSSADHGPQSILVTSAVAGEGKSTTVINLGIALAQTGARTLIMELDMRRPTLASTLGIAGRHGMSRYLSGQSEMNTEIQQTGVPNLFVVGAGPIPPNPPELIGSVRMISGLQLLKRHFEHIVIDAPPLMPVTDALIVSPRVDGVILVVHGGKTSKALVQKARNMLRSVDAKILGALINNVKLDSELEYGYYPALYARTENNYAAGERSAELHVK